MTRLVKDGRDADQRSVFEEMRLKLEAQEAMEKTRSSLNDHPMLTKHGENIDVQLDMLWDWNHVIKMKLTNSTDDIQLIPSTSMQDMILLHNDCRGCWSMHGSKWTPDINIPLGLTMKKKAIDFFYMMNIYDAKVEGHYWMTNACFNTNTTNCATNLIVYAIQRAKPWFNSLGDGYFGLAPSNSIDLGDSSNNILEQMYFHGMVTKKQFGVHTHMRNSTEDPSTIRFGGYNEELFKAGHE